MGEEQKPNNNNIENSDSLELEDGQAPPQIVVEAPAKSSIFKKIKSKITGLNIYFLIFLLILVISGIVTFLLWQTSKKAEQVNTETITFEQLSQQTIDDLRNKDSTIGDAQQTLTVASNSVFNGRVLIRDSLDVAGTINVGGSLSLPGITVSGTSTFETVDVSSNLTIGGDTAVLGNANIQGNLNVSGGGTFGGILTAASITIDSLTLNNNIQLNRHIDTGGGIPGATAGGAVGGGGTVNINGTDTAGTVNINTSASASSGTLAVITFVRSFNQTPHIVISPVGSSASSINYYITRTTSGFTIATSSPAPASSSLTFDYIALE
ncbi:hypothetical protein KC878_01870 [Candidatus Saccharibacteria bacterium]|nr:hypothetical protein [Candidatus Saccharibacteria bacterium]